MSISILIFFKSSQASLFLEGCLSKKDGWKIAIDLRFFISFVSIFFHFPLICVITVLIFNIALAAVAPTNTNIFGLIKSGAQVKLCAPPHLIQKGIEGYSTLLLGSGIGALLGGGMLALFGNLKNSSKLQFICTLGIGISLILFSQSTWIYTSVLILIFVAGFNSAFAAINNTIIQSIVTEEFRGRVMSIHQMAWGTGAFGGLIIGLTAQIYSVQVALTIFGTITFISSGILGITILKNKPYFR